MLVIGGSSGIGYATAAGALADGASVEAFFAASPVFDHIVISGANVKFWGA
ncbi:short chain dehydrogenase [mine drainage metagenome]|uniref:Short chain dehydrogenase n=1 Tax=mine drainage metagenome TaxID=410659 RepID=A0A1J5RIP6_9ZZZZ